MTTVLDNRNSTPPFAPDRSTPILEGDVFCSPACGFKCKLADFEKATAGAAALVAELGAGWTPRVRENCMWHFSAEKGAATVDFHESGGFFTARIDAGFFDKHAEQFRATGSTPRAAMEAVLAKVEHKIAALKRTALSASLEPLALASS